MVLAPLSEHGSRASDLIGRVSRQYFSLGLEARGPVRR